MRESDVKRCRFNADWINYQMASSSAIGSPVSPVVRLLAFSGRGVVTDWIWYDTSNSLSDREGRPRSAGSGQLGAKKRSSCVGDAR